MIKNFKKLFTSEATSKVKDVVVDVVKKGVDEIVSVKKESPIVKSNFKSHDVPSSSSSLIPKSGDLGEEFQIDLPVRKQKSKLSSDMMGRTSLIKEETTTFSKMKKGFFQLMVRPQNARQLSDTIMRDFYVMSRQGGNMKGFEGIIRLKEIGEGTTVSLESNTSNKTLGFSPQSKGVLTVQPGKDSTKFSLQIGENITGNITDSLRFVGRAMMGMDAMSFILGDTGGLSSQLPGFMLNVSCEGASSRTLEVVVPRKLLQESGADPLQELAGFDRPGVKCTATTTEGFKGEVSLRANKLVQGLEIIGFGDQAKAFLKTLSGMSPNFKVALTCTAGNIQNTGSETDRTVFQNKQVEIAFVMNDGVDGGLLMERGAKVMMGERIDTGVVPDDELGERIVTTGSKKTQTLEGPLPAVRQGLKMMIDSAKTPTEKESLERVMTQLNEEAHMPTRILTALLPESSSMVTALLKLRDGSQSEEFLGSIDKLVSELRQPIDENEGMHIGEGGFSAEAAAHFMEGLKGMLEKEQNPQLRSSLEALSEKLQSMRSTYSVSVTQNLTEEGASRINEAKATGNKTLLRKELSNPSNYTYKSCALTKVSPETIDAQQSIRGPSFEGISQVEVTKSKFKTPMLTDTV